MTETNGAVTATRPPPYDNPDTVGKVVPYAEIKVKLTLSLSTLSSQSNIIYRDCMCMYMGDSYNFQVIDEVGEVVGEGEEGEVCTRGPGMMLGYANNQTATAATLDTEGWIHTGDVGYYDQNDFIYITDRRKDLIKVKG